MEFSLPGQLKGPECLRVVKQAIALRHLLEPWIAMLQHVSIRKLSIVLRIDGSIGSFGSPGVENIEVDGGELHCDLVISDHGWAELSDEQIAEVLRQQVSLAVSVCLSQHKVEYCPDSLRQAMLPNM